MYTYCVCRFWRGLNLFSQVDFVLAQDFAGGISSRLDFGHFQFDGLGYVQAVFDSTSMATVDIVLLCCDIYTWLYMLYLVTTLVLKSQVFLRAGLLAFA